MPSENRLLKMEANKMYNRNQVSLIGNIGDAFKSGISSSGIPYASFSFATTDHWKDSDGKSQSHTEWHVVVCWGKLAELVGKYLTRGSYVAVEGSLRRRDYATEAGEKRRTWEVHAVRIGFLEPFQQHGAEELVSSSSSSSSVEPLEIEAPF
jgi:single-strand DNA-binding protein